MLCGSCFKLPGSTLIHGAGAVLCNTLEKSVKDHEGEKSSEKTFFTPLCTGIITSLCTQIIN